MAETAQIRARQGWSAPAKRAFRDVVAEYPTLEKVKLTALYAACDLISEADKMQETIGSAYVVEGSQGQPVAHPLVAEVRQYRRAALDTFRAIGVDAKGSSASAAGSALVQKRWSSRPSGDNVTPITKRAPF